MNFGRFVIVCGIAIVAQAGAVQSGSAATKHARLTGNIVTTPAISKACQKYADKHSGRGRSQLKDRHATFLACVQRKSHRH
jgi:hypothetical protein